MPEFYDREDWEDERDLYVKGALEKGIGSGDLVLKLQKDVFSFGTLNFKADLSDNGNSHPLHVIDAVRKGLFSLEGAYLIYENGVFRVKPGKKAGDELVLKTELPEEFTEIGYQRYTRFRD